MYTNDISCTWGARKMRKNKNVIIVLVLLIVLLISLISWNQYIKANTTYVYGEIPPESVPIEYEKIDYTIPVVDKNGKRGMQSFSVENPENIGSFVKLHVYKDKVKEYEFITQEELPKAVENNL